jgi:hypothetical protein
VQKRCHHLAGGSLRADGSRAIYRWSDIDMMIDY